MQDVLLDMAGSITTLSARLQARDRPARMSLLGSTQAKEENPAGDAEAKREASKKKGYDFSQSNVSQKDFDFGPQEGNVDWTLATLFDTLSVECR